MSQVSKRQENALVKATSDKGIWGTGSELKKTNHKKNKNKKRHTLRTMDT